MKEHWDEFSALMAAGEEKLAGKKEFAYKESGEGESEMVVCVRVRPRLMIFKLSQMDILTHILIFTNATNKQSKNNMTNLALPVGNI